MQLLASLHRRFNPRRLELLAARAQRQAELDAGALPDFVQAHTPLAAVEKASGPAAHTRRGIGQTIGP